MELQTKRDLSVLSELKEFRYEQIDIRTGELIRGGFAYNGKTFSLSANAQLNLTGADNARNDLTYPLDWNTKDDSETQSIADATEMHNFYLTALSAKKGHLDSGTNLKKQVRDAVDITAVNAIVDNR